MKRKSVKHRHTANRHNHTSEVSGCSVLLSLLTFIGTIGMAEVHAQNATRNAVPRLVVNILVDQLRSDYLQAFMPLYGENGWKRLLGEGLVYAQAEYPLTGQDRACAAATIATGTTPSRHGIVAAKWLDRATLRPTFCVSDPTLDGNGATSRGVSPKYLAVSTIGDELKVATEGKALVYSIAPSSDAAILSAGHAADGAVWIDDATGKWSTSAYYGNMPAWVGALSAYGSLAGRLADTTWKPSGDLVGNFSYFLSGGMKKPFAHKFKGDSRFADFKSSGLVNDEIAKAASACITHTSVGGDAITDYIAVTLYAGNYQHRPVSEMPMELQDTYVRIDGALSQIIQAVEDKVGKGQALLVLTSTGTADEETADLTKYRIPTGTFDVKRAATLLNMYLVAVYGQGQYVEATMDTQIYLDHRLIESKQINMAEMLERSQDLLMQMSGVKDVYTSWRLMQGAWTPGISRIRAGYNPQYSGDILIEVSPGWHFHNEDTGVRKLVRESYIPFPIIFWGQDIEAGVATQPVTVDYIAPTLSQAMRIRAPNACNLPPLLHGKGH